MPRCRAGLQVAFFCLSAGIFLGCGRNPAADELPQGHIDNPVSHSSAKDIAGMGGWAEHPSGVEAVGIYIDGQYYRRARLGVERADVLKARPEFRKGTVEGWDIAVETAALPVGTHTLTAKIIANSGAQRDFSVEVNVAR